MKANEAQLKKQLTALISAIRPSILWSIDGTTAPLDLLDDDGITGWQIGLGSIISEFGDLSLNGFSHVIDWIQRDQELEKLRWQSPQVTLTQARIVFGSRCQLPDNQALLDRWASNIDAAFVRSPSSMVAPLPSTQRQAIGLSKLLTETAGAAEIVGQLDHVINLKPRPESSPNSAPQKIVLQKFTDDNGLVAASDLKRLQPWLGVAANIQPNRRFAEHRKRQLAS